MSLIKRTIYFSAFQLVLSSALTAQTLQDVTQNGATTNTSITASSFIANTESLNGTALPANISSLPGLRINGNLSGSGHNGITFKGGVGGAAGIGFYRDFSQGTSIDFYTSNTDNQTGDLIHRLRIAENGKVGIGITKPRAILDVGSYINNEVVGTVLGRLFEGDNVKDGTFLGVRGYGTQERDYHGKSFSLEHSFYGDVNSSINFYRGIGSIGGFLAFNTDNNSEKVRILPNGNVGIGTTTPPAKLTVAGNILAREIKVAVEAGADYVLCEDYNLKPLLEIENFIKTNHRLPEVASAGTMEKDGINLGEMNILLLKKIEELTLYIIQQGKRITQLESKSE